MPAYVAFLRGMNLGKRRVRNEELCKCFEGLDLDQVSAFLASGNVLFSSRKSASKLATLIESGMREFFDYEVPTFIRSAQQIQSIAQHIPFDAKQSAHLSGKLQIAMLKAAPTKSQVARALEHGGPEDALSVCGTELYWLPAGNMSESELDVKALGKILGPMTIRTHRTLERLVPKLK